MVTAAEIVLPERFRLHEEVGRGGMAVVYRAHDQHLDRFVAIKVLSPHLSHAMGVERFQREIALMAKLVHPGIVALFDSGEAGGRLYYVMPLVAGENLRARLARERRMTPEDAAGFGADVAEALAYAHGAGIVHRDVKPENIFTVGGRAVLADFGIAHIVADQSSDGTGLTSAGMVLGTVTYMSPEQAEGAAHIDGRSDLYSLGCVLYEMVTGAPPFSAESPIGVLTKHLTEAPRPARESSPGLSAAFNEIIMRLLSKRPDQRPATAGEVARALRSVGPRTDPGIEPVESTDADRLVQDGLNAILHSVSAGGSRRSHLDQAGVYLRRALSLNPRHARALCALANWHYTMARAGFLPAEDASTRGRDLLMEALAADDRVAIVHSSLGRIALFYDDNCHAAARHVERAVQLDPGDADALRFQSVVFKVLGRLEDSVRVARQATLRAPELATLWNGLGDSLLAAGRNAEAVEPLKRAIALQPRYDNAMERLELAYVRLGEMERAAETRISRLRLTGPRERADLMARELATSGPATALSNDRRRELEALLKQAEQSDPFADPSQTVTLADRIIAAHAALGEWTRAMDWVERAYQHRPIRLRRVLTEPLYDRRGLAADPRYARLLRAAVLEDLL